jgi:hypothetical protein
VIRPTGAGKRPLLSPNVNMPDIVFTTRFAVTRRVRPSLRCSLDTAARVIKAAFILPISGITSRVA